MKNGVEFFLSPLSFNLFIIHWETLKTNDDSTIISLLFPPRLAVILCISITTTLSGPKAATVKIKNTSMENTKARLTRGDS